MSNCDNMAVSFEVEDISVEVVCVEPQIEVRVTLSPTWADVAGKPTTFPPQAHSHAIGDVSGAVASTDARLSDAREWSAATVSQAEAEAGTATDRRAFTALRVFQAVAAWWAGSAAKTKLDGIATGATANATDAQLRDRSTHTGTQAHTTITGLGGAATLNVGTAAGTVAAGNDSRLTDSRTPTDGSVTDAKIASGGLSTSSLSWSAIQPWAANTAYAKGDLVSFQGIAYRRSAAGTSGATFNIANWQQITPSNPVISVDGATGAVTVTKAEVYDFLVGSKPASATGSGGSYSWTIPATARYVTIFCHGAGAGGGSGRRGAAGSARCGGGGGGAGGWSELTYSVAELPSSTLSVTVIAGGAGGAAVTTDNTDGNTGSHASGLTKVDSGSRTICAAWGSGRGSGGGSAATAAGGDNWWSSQWTPTAAPSAGRSAAAGDNSAQVLATASRGAGGGGVDSGNTHYAGGAGGASPVMLGASAGPVGGTAGGGAGPAGTAWVKFGGGGSGGGGNNAGAGGNGGNGAFPGGGGGGGGASLNGFNSGAGGNGGDGVVRITVWY